MKIAFGLVVVLLYATGAGAQETIKGRVTDKSGAALPGVEIVASSREVQQKAVTDSSGLYQISDLPAGTYSVTAALVGFVTGKRESLAVGAGRVVHELNFALCLGSLDEIDWAVPRDLAEAWGKAQVVAYVQVVETRRVQSACPSNDFLHTATVIESFKGELKPGDAGTLTFRQENWASERTPYKIGQKIILFLAMHQGQLWRVSGPYCAFLVNGGEITSVRSPMKTGGVTLDGLLSTLRALARTGK